MVQREKKEKTVINHIENGKLANISTIVAKSVLEKSQVRSVTLTPTRRAVV